MANAEEDKGSSNIGLSYIYYLFLDKLQYCESVAHTLYWIFVNSKTRRTQVSLRNLSFLQHILNLVFAIGELMLNCMPHFTYLMGFMGLYTATYGVLAFTFFLQTGRWIYPVSLSTTSRIP